MSLTSIYDVTRALRMLLYSQLSQVSTSAVVTLLPPGEALPDASGVNLYLYRVVESPATKNRDWPGDKVTAPANVPVLGLELSYLLTPLGKTPDDASSDLGDDAHTMLGVAMGTLARYPVVNDVHIAGFDADAVLTPALLDSYEQVKVSLLPTDIDTLSKIWATINQPYRLSVAYEVSLVEVVPTDPLPSGNGFPVANTVIGMSTVSAPVIDSVQPPIGPLATVDAAGNLNPATLILAGGAFASPGATTAVQLGGNAATIAAAPAPNAATLGIVLPTELGAGPELDVTVSVGGLTSAPARFVVAPWLARVTPLRTALDAGATPLALQGAGFGPAGAYVRLEQGATVTDLGPVATGATDTEASVTLPATLANGDYTIRLVRGDGGATNGRGVSVIPRLSGATVTVVHPATADVHQLNLTGARLNGTSMHVVLDGVDYAAPANATATTLSYTFARLLDPGPHVVQVSVDGSVSHAAAFTV